eukprot:1144409-Pelagomonas_calceolata.AAC.8
MGLTPSDHLTPVCELVLLRKLGRMLGCPSLPQRCKLFTHKSFCALKESRQKGCKLATLSLTRDSTTTTTITTTHTPAHQTQKVACVTIPRVVSTASMRACSCGNNALFPQMQSAKVFGPAQPAMSGSALSRVFEMHLRHGARA